MDNDCKMGECPANEYKDTIVVPNPWQDENGSGGDGSYVLPVATQAALGGIKSSNGDYEITVDQHTGKAKLANAEGLAHDLDNYHKLSAIVGKMTDDDVAAVKALVNKPSTGDTPSIGSGLTSDELTKLQNLLGIYSLDDSLGISEAGELFARNIVAWRANTDYVEGEIVLYDNKLYVVLQDYTSGESFPIIAPATSNDDLLMITGGKDAAKRSFNLPTNVFYNVSATDYNQDDITLHFVNKDLSTGGDSAITLDLEAATAPYESESGQKMPSHAGVMTGAQAEQLAALAEAYQNTTQGITLYEGSASVNYVDLNDNAWNYDHIVVIGEYISEGSSSFHQSVSTEFYPNGETNTFQLNAIDIVTNDIPVQTIWQDIWQLDTDGMELALVSGFKSSYTGGTSPSFDVTPETTSIFTITKVVGYGKKV